MHGPPPRLVGQEPQRAVRAEGRLHHGHPFTARDDDGFAGALLAELGAEELGGVPRHARVAPGDPRQYAAVGRDGGARDEVGAGGQHHAALGVVAVQVEPHQLVGRFRVA